ncbi:g7324 [Coccomyxa elongata]
MNSSLIRWLNITVLGAILADGSIVQRKSLDFTYRWAYTPLQTTNLSSTLLKYSHMGMLSILPNKSLAAAWQGSEDWWEGGHRQAIYWALSQDGGLSWGQHKIVVPSSHQLPLWGPVLHVEDDTVYLFFAVSHAQCWWHGEGGMHWACGGDVMMQRSLDSGSSWQEPQMVYSFDEEGGIAKMIANKLTISSRGHWLLPFWREMGGQPECNMQPAKHGMPGLLVSPDKGASWRVIDIMIDPQETPTWLIEGALSAGSSKGMYIMLFRTSAGHIYSSESYNDGMHWTPARRTQLPNPNAKVDVVLLPEDVLLVAYNDNAESSRDTLALASSGDGGHTWVQRALLETNPSGSFHYPTLLYDSSQDKIFVIYSVDFLPGKNSNALVDLPALHADKTDENGAT